MSEAGKRILDAATEMVAVAKGEQPAARIHVSGHAYVPEAALAAAEAREARLRAALRPIIDYPGIREFMGNLLYDAGCAALSEGEAK